MHSALALALHLICQVCTLQDPAQPISQDTWWHGFTRQLSISDLHLGNVSWAIFIILPNYFKHEFKSWIGVHRSGSNLHPSVKWGQAIDPKACPEQPLILPATSPDSASSWRSSVKYTSLWGTFHHIQTRFLPPPTKYVRNSFRIFSTPNPKVFARLLIHGQ